MFALPEHLHPMVVHFPIALFLMAMAFEVIGLILKNENFHTSAVYMFVAAALMTPLIVKTGMWEAESLQISHPILEQHEHYALGLMWTALMFLPVLWFIRREFSRYFKVLFIVALITSAVLVSFTADKGGTMVFEYGVGVEQM